MIAWAAVENIEADMNILSPQSDVLSEWPLQDLKLHTEKAKLDPREGSPGQLA